MSRTFHLDRFHCVPVPLQDPWHLGAHTPFVGDLRHGNAEQVQATIDSVVDNALNPRQPTSTRLLHNPMEQTPGGRPQADLSRGRQVTSEPRPQSNINFGGRMVQTEHAVQKHTDELVQFDKSVILMQGENSLIKLHLQKEQEARNNVAQSVEHRITQIEQLIRASQGATTAAAENGSAAAPIQHKMDSITPVRSAAAVPDPWYQFLNGPDAVQPAASLTGNAQTGNAQTQYSNNIPGFVEKEWTIEKKVSKELKAFDDNWEMYEGWCSRMREHAATSNTKYLHIFDLIEKTGRPIRSTDLDTLSVEGLKVNWRLIAIKLWTFIGDNVTNLIHSRRTQLTQGDEFNGIELWRSLYIKHKGGAEQMTLAGMGTFLSFPKCPGMDQIQSHVGEWQLNRTKYGSGISDAHLKLMFLATLPAEVVSDIKRRTDIVTSQGCVDYVIEQMGTYNDKRLASQQASRLQKTLGNSRPAPLSPLLEQPTTQEAPMPDSDAVASASLAAQMVRVEAMVAALNRKPPAGRPAGRGANADKPDPRFEGCWHCHKPGHVRMDCTAFKKIIAANGGKKPPGYEGAIENIVRRSRHPQQRHPLF